MKSEVKEIYDILIERPDIVEFFKLYKSLPDNLKRIVYKAIVTNDFDILKGNVTND